MRLNGLGRRMRAVAVTGGQPEKSDGAFDLAPKKEEPNADSNKPGAVVDLRTGSQTPAPSDYQTDLDSNNPNGVNSLDPTSPEGE